jgi:hypothetical protein
MKRQWNAEEMKEAARDAYCSAHGEPLCTVTMNP